MPKEMEMNAWMTRSTIQFEMYLEQKLELLEEAAELVNMASASVGNGAGSESVNKNVFQLSEGLRVLPSTFLDESHRFIEALYINLPTGFGGDRGGAKDSQGAISQDVFNSGAEEDDSSHAPFLYGEASSLGVRQIYNHLIGGDPDGTKKGGGGLSFIDLGSGVGKLVVEMAHYHHHHAAAIPSTSTAATFLGIELDKERAQVGDMALNADTFTAEFSSKSTNHVSNVPRVELVQGDMFQLLPNFATRNENLEEGASHFLFCCGVGFSNAFVEKLCSLIYDTYAPQIQGSALKGCILLFKQHPRGHPLYAHANTQEMITIGTSWMNEAPAVLLKFRPIRVF